MTKKEKDCEGVNLETIKKIKRISLLRFYWFLIDNNPNSIVHVEGLAVLKVRILI